MKRAHTWWLMAVLSIVSACSINDWSEFKSPDGDFAVSFPGDPIQENHRMRTMARASEVVAYGVKSKNVTYVVRHFQYAAYVAKNVEPKNALDGTRDATVRRVRGKLLNERTIEMNGVPGREMRISVPNVDEIYHARAYYKDGHIYLLEVGSATAPVSEENVRKFFESFALTI